MDLGIKGKVAIVMAGSQGLGKATARALAREGAKVALCARGTNVLDETAREIRRDFGVEVFAETVDVTNSQAIREFADAISAALGPAGILVNNAGGPPPGKFDSLSNEDWDRAYRLTMMSAVEATRAFLPAMRAQRWGRVVNISSYSIKQPIPQLMLSNTMRMGVLGWAKSIVEDLAPEGVTVNTVCPGWVSTDRVGSLVVGQARARNIAEGVVAGEIIDQIPMKRMGTPEEIADLVAFLASERAGYITGVAIQADGGIVKGPY